MSRGNKRIPAGAVAAVFIVIVVEPDAISLVPAESEFELTVIVSLPEAK